MQSFHKISEQHLVQCYFCGINLFALGNINTLDAFSDFFLTEVLFVFLMFL